MIQSGQQRGRQRKRNDMIPKLHTATTATTTITRQSTLNKPLFNSKSTLSIFNFSQKTSFLFLLCQLLFIIILVFSILYSNSSLKVRSEINC